MSWEEGPLQADYCRAKSNPGEPGMEDSKDGENLPPALQPRTQGVPGRKCFCRFVGDTEEWRWVKSEG